MQHKYYSLLQILIIFLYFIVSQFAMVITIDKGKIVINDIDG